MVKRSGGGGGAQGPHRTPAIAWQVGGGDRDPHRVHATAWQVGGAQGSTQGTCYSLAGG